VESLIRTKGYTQSQIARFMGLSPFFISKMANGRTGATKDQIQALAHILDTPADQLINEEDFGLAERHLEYQQLI
jgi:transcriptional regulator with XRE-family HTH domain